MAVGGAIGLTQEEIEKGIAALKGVGGRMTTVDEGQAFSVIVDYAHTPDSFENLFNDLQPIVKGKLIVLFGSAGRRDESKRAIQGELAGKYATKWLSRKKTTATMTAWKSWSRSRRVPNRPARSVTVTCSWSTTAPKPSRSPSNGPASQGT